MKIVNKKQGLQKQLKKKGKAMTKKDFIILAKILGQVEMSRECLGASVYDNAQAIDDYLKTTNPNYNSQKFWQAVRQEAEEDANIIGTTMEE